MRALEINDHVAVKLDSSLYGTVQRTNTDSYEPLEDELIIAHTPVPTGVLNEFLVRGVPPPGYVFVQFADEAAGSSLVSEDDLTLLSRVFQIGDTVKRDGSPMTGAVINVSETYTLEPVATNKDFIKCFGLDPLDATKCTAGSESLVPPNFAHPNPHSLLYDVPAREVKRAQDVIKEDYIIYKDWLGIADEVEYEVAIMLKGGSVVVVNGLESLHIPVPDYGKPLVALPEPDGFKRPDILVARQGWSSTIPVQMPRPGTFVIIDRSALRSSKTRWIEGEYDTSIAHGYVLDVRACRCWVDWVGHKPSPRWPGRCSKSPPPPLEVYVYAPYRDRTDRPGLRPNQYLRLYDRGLAPSKAPEEESSVPDSESYAIESDNTQDVCPGQDIAIGVHVRFRNPKAAEAKYQRTAGTGHGNFPFIPPELSDGWDINEYKVVYIKQQATVMWQDGTITTTDSTLLEEYGLFETELAPTDIILKREGMRQRSVGRPRVTKDFNEVTFHEGPHDLLPQSVGVVQSVDTSERVARVRWFKEPKLELRSFGQLLAPNSRFGSIGDQIEDVSLYEIMSFPCLQRRRRDLCIIAPPRAVSNRTKSLDLSDQSQTLTSVDQGIPGTAGTDSSTPSENAAGSSSPSSTTSPEQRDRAPRPIDWVGEIVATGFDGSITVRLGASQPCRDIRIDSDSIGGLIADRETMEEMNGDLMDLDSWGDDDSMFSYADSVEPIAESVEYEGGERLDADSGDENWVSDEDEAFTDAHEEFEEEQHSEMEETVGQANEPPSSTKEQRSILQLQAAMPNEAPPQFLVLDILPPPDQFGLHSPSTAGASFLKRIMREHRILATSLPVGEIYVRTYENRLDLLRCLIIGPKDTPYENAPFLIDLYLPEGYPDVPPTAHFHSWTSGLGRINPNLYEEGKICLSLLGTWSGKHESESWSDKATILQLLVSLQGLVFVKAPFYNEAGFEGYEHEQKYLRESEQYSEKAFVMARGFVKHAILRPPGGLDDVLAWIYVPHEPSNPQESLLGTIIERGRRLIEQSEAARWAGDEHLLDSAGGKDNDTRVFLKPISRGASVMLKRTITELQEQLDRLRA